MASTLMKIAAMKAQLAELERQAAAEAERDARVSEAHGVLERMRDELAALGFKLSYAIEPADAARTEGERAEAAAAAAAAPAEPKAKRAPHAWALFVKSTGELLRLHGVALPKAEGVNSLFSFCSFLKEERIKEEADILAAAGAWEIDAETLERARERREAKRVAASGGASEEEA